MSSYLDSSTIVAPLTRESGTSQAQRIIAEVEGPHISDWVTTECSAALSFKVRIGALPGEERQRAWANFERMRSTFETLQVLRADFELAAELAAMPGIAVRGADALHLAIATRREMTLVTLDKRLSAAAASAKCRYLLLIAD